MIFSYCVMLLTCDVVLCYGVSRDGWGSGSHVLRAQGRKGQSQAGSNGRQVEVGARMYIIILYRVVFLTGPPPKMLKYIKPRLGVSRNIYVSVDTPPRI